VKPAYARGLDDGTLPGMAKRRDPKAMARALARRRRQRLSWSELSSATGIPTSTLQWWQRRLRAEAVHNGKRFVEVVVTPQPSRSPLTVVVGNGRRVIVPAEFDAEHLRRVIAAVESEC
jgi:hypothetical protein